MSSRPDTASGRKSRAASVLGHDDSQSIICAVSEARGVSPAVGVAFVNVSLGEVILSQICDNQSYVKTIHKIQMMGPSRILFMSTACPPHGSSTLFTLVQEHIPEAQLDAMDRSAWSEMAGMDYIKDLAFESDIEPIKVAIQGKYYATASFSAVSYG
jgi:DNA mismatch repair protein MSH4